MYVRIEIFYATFYTIANESNNLQMSVKIVFWSSLFLTAIHLYEMHHWVEYVAYNVCYVPSWNKNVDIIVSADDEFL